MRISKIIAALTVSASCLLAGETAPVAPTQPVPPAPPTPPAPNTPPKAPVLGPITVTATPTQNPYAELTPALVDLQSADEAKRADAVKKFVEKGGLGYRLLNGLSTSADPVMAQRAKDVRAAIEKRANEMFQAAEAMQLKLQNAPLTAAAIEPVRAAWSAAAAYVPQPAFRQQAQQAEMYMRSQLNEIENANKIISDCDTRLKATPAPGNVMAASIHLERAQALVTLQRVDDAAQSAKQASDIGGKICRHTPAALKIQLEMAQKKQDGETIEALCKKLTSEQSDSFEAAFAWSALVDFYSEKKRWDEAVAAVKTFMNLCPLDEAAQESAYGLLDKLMDSEHDYPRAYGLSGHLRIKLPPSRMKPEILKVLGGCSEYAMKDFAKAEDAYKGLGEQYADIVQAADIDGAIKRIKAKAEGKFPKEPKPEDEGAAGALAKFLAAVRARDAKKLSEVVLTALAKDTADALNAEGSELVQSVTFADFVVKAVNVDGDKADVVLDYYDAANSTPRAITEKAVKENGVWKIQWQDPETLLNPAAKKK